MSDNGLHYLYVYIKCSAIFAAFQFKCHFSECEQTRKDFQVMAVKVRTEKAIMHTLLDHNAKQPQPLLKPSFPM